MLLAMLRIALWIYAVVGTLYWLMRNSEIVEQYAVGMFFVLMWLAPVTLAGLVVHRLGFLPIPWSNDTPEDR